MAAQFPIPSSVELESCRIELCIELEHPPTIQHALGQVLDMLLVWSRSLDTATSLCDKPGGMTEIAIKHFQVTETEVAP